MMEAGENMSYSAKALSAVSGSCGNVVPEVSVIVTLNQGYDAEDLLIAPDISYSTVIDNMVIATVPVDKLELLASSEAVANLTVGRKRDFNMTFARSTAGVNIVQSGTGLPRAFTGKGVVISMYDGGFDPNHVNFAESGKPSSSRVRAMYVYGNSGSTEPTVSASTREEIKKITTDDTKETHGTHVAGIAAGSFRGTSDYGMNGQSYKNSNMPYYGVATDADIVLAAGQLTDTHILAGVTKCIEYAESVKKPVVVNLSLGSIIGPHDGSSALSQGLAKLGSRAIICVASGNDGQYKKAMTLEGGTDDSELVNSAVGLSYGTSTVTKPYTINFWSRDRSVFVMDFVIYNTATKEVEYSLNIPNTKGRGIAIGGTGLGSAYTKDEVFSKAFSATSYIEFYSEVESNNRYCVAVEFLLNNNATNSTLKPGFRFTRKEGQVIYGYIDTPTGQSAGQFKLETGSDWNGLQWDAAAVNNNGTLNDLATGDNILAVGAYTSSPNFTVTAGSNYSYRDATAVNEICSFSSYGHNTVTGEALPHVTAPGSAIVSSINEHKTSYSTNAVSGNTRQNERDNRWGSMQGTSMAAPFVTGVVGLWLEADPSLTIDDVKDIVKTTSVPYTGTDADKLVQSGAGRIDALAGIKEVLARRAASIGTVVADEMQWLVIPTSDGYELAAPGAEGIEAYVYDMQGRCVTSVSAPGSEVSVATSGLMPGVYVLRAQAAGMVHTTKVVVR
ncbi:MAG: S8 family peptidase [Paramuribaculum sp.]|nr:S8 family peptidase [Paramuribaculum sp.]